MGAVKLPPVGPILDGLLESGRGARAVEQSPRAFGQRSNGSKTRMSRMIMVWVSVGCLATSGLASAQAFLDVTEVAGLGGAHIHGQSLVKTHVMMSGIAIGDYDNDGWQDIFWTAGSGQPARLFRNKGNGSFEERAARADVDVTFSMSMPLWFDGDGDGDVDLLVQAHEKAFSFSAGADGPGGEGSQTHFLMGAGNAPPFPWWPEHFTSFRNFYFRNEGDGTFRERAESLGLLRSGQFGAAAGDIDGDGDLDLLGVSWSAEPTHMLRNDGGRFRDATPAVVEDTYTRGFAPRLVDMDDDGDLDAIWSGDFGTSKYFRNDGGWQFTDMTKFAGVGSDENGMGTTVGDVDNDGDLDWFVSSIWDDEPHPDSSVGTSGNRLYLNDGAGSFTDGTDGARVRNGEWGWGADFADIDNDGDLDLLHTNGWNHAMYTQYVTDPLRAFINNGRGVFIDQAASLGLAETHQGRGLVVFDYDQDGRLDVLVGNNEVGLSLYRNLLDLSQAHWVQVELRDTTTANTHGIGAKLVVTTIGGVQQTRVIEAGSNYMSQSPAEAWFGLGRADRFELEVRWPDGGVTMLEEQDADQRLVVTRG